MSTMDVPPTFRLEILTRGNRHEVLTRVHEAVRVGGASVTDFHQFSNQSVCLSLEVPLKHLADLHTALEPFAVTPVREAFLAPFSSPQTWPKEADLQGTLALRFFHEEPDLKLVIPAVPG